MREYIIGILLFLLGALISNLYWLGIIVDLKFLLPAILISIVSVIWFGAATACVFDKRG